MDTDRSDGGGRAAVDDDFACPGTLRGSLLALRGAVERIFRVTLGIGADDPPHGNGGQIWLKLRGAGVDVKAAKLFVRGVVNQEEQQEVPYPRVLHCVFCGARGLFMDVLIRSTSAHLLVGSPGLLRISGLTEPVVRAYSLITELVERYKGSSPRGESLDSCRAFRTLVEKWEDRHLLDLLVLPGSVKEILLDLVKESGLGSNLAVTDGETRVRDDPRDRRVEPPEPSYASDWLVEGTTGASEEDSVQLFSIAAGARGPTEGSEERVPPPPQEVGEEDPPEQREEPGSEEEPPSMGNKEFWLLLKFFSAMGYTEEVVKRALARTGPQEASQILDLVQQEQDRQKLLQRDQDQKHLDAVTLHKSKKNRPCETEHRADGETDAGQDAVISPNGPDGEVLDGEVLDGEVLDGEVRGGEERGATGGTRPGEGGCPEEKDGHEEDFVLGVMKKAAASCGYTEQEVAKVYNMLPDGSSHLLLPELQRESDAFRDGPREMDDVVLEEGRPEGGPGVGPGGGPGPGVGPVEDLETRGSEDGRWVEVPHLTAPDLVPWINNPHQQTSGPSGSQGRRQILLPEVKGPPMSTYPSDKQSEQVLYWTDPTSSCPNLPPLNDVSSPMPGSVKEAPRPPSPTQPPERRGFTPASSVVVTGEQRFLEGLQTPFELRMTDRPGDAELRTMVVDGSNVAMSHGLGHFFSCRGIALSVQHFWDRGHRHISVFLPQWRQKSDPRVKEQHYLTELQQLGLLSYTPSREVQGKRISSYDDRFMLQLAQRTDGVIVTNDNLRDLLDESPAWRDIIKKRLLQYTFVGDHFMVPDDPLGRGGPHLDDFLRSGHRTPNPRNHSFAGVATTFPFPKPPRSQTEVLNFRDRTPGGGVDPGGRGGRGRGRGHRKGRDLAQQQHRPHGGAGAGPGAGPVFRADRSPEETSSLRQQLCQVFPGQDNVVTLVLQVHPTQTDVNLLSDLILQQQD